MTQRPQILRVQGEGHIPPHRRPDRPRIPTQMQERMNESEWECLKTATRKAIREWDAIWGAEVAREKRFYAIRDAEAAERAFARRRAARLAASVMAGALAVIKAQLWAVSL